MISRNLGQDDPDAAGDLDRYIGQAPHGSAADSRTTGTPAAASRVCPACTSRTWIQSIVERLGESGRLAAISDVRSAFFWRFSSMLAGFACIELFEEHAGLGCLGTGEPFEDDDGITPAAAREVGPAAGAQR